jgi:hypothetical protein
LRGFDVPSTHDVAVSPSVKAEHMPKLAVTLTGLLARARWRLLGFSDRAALGMWAAAH